MGTFRYPVEVGPGENGPFISLDVLVDTGATYTLLPRRVVAELRVEPRTQDEFILADGRRVIRDMAQVHVRLAGEILPTLCVIQDEADDALLGAYTLEGFELVADPVNKRLAPAPKYLLENEMAPRLVLPL